MTRTARENDPQILNTTGGAGHASNAMSQSNANRNALGSKKNPRNKAGLGTSVKSDPIDFVKPSEEELQKMKELIQKKSLDEKKRQTVLFVSILIVIATILVIIFG